MSKTKAISLEHLEFPVIDAKTDEIVYRKALHHELCVKTLSGVEYYAPPHHFNENALELKQYIPVLDDIIADLQWLLMLNHAKFWCQVVNDDSVHALLNSYLRRAPRYKQLNLAENLQRKHSLVHRLVFLVFLRMSTLKETKSDFMSKDYFGNLIYDNFLFDIPRLMDICALYGNQNNIKLVRKLVHSVFESQPSYVTDLSLAAKTVIQVLSQTEQKCCGGKDENSPASLNDGLPGTHLEEITDLDFADLIRFLSDIMFTLKSFMVEVYPRSTSKFFEVDLIGKLSTVYCEVLKSLKTNLRVRKSSISFPVFCELKTHIRLTEDAILTIVYHIIKLCLLDPVIKSYKESPENKETLAEKYFEALTSLLSQQVFIRALHQKYDLSKDVTAVIQTCPEMNGTQTTFILNSLKEDSPKPKEKHQISKQKPATKMTKQTNTAAKTKEESLGEEKDKDIQMMLLVSSVQDLFHDLETPFIEACLKRFDMNPEKVIQMILDDNLPPDIQEMKSTTGKSEVVLEEDHSKIEVEPHDLEEIPGTSGLGDIITERKNVFDNDEFDIMAPQAQNVFETSRIHRGKRESSNIKHWGEEAEFERLKELYNKYDLVREGESEEEEFSVPVLKSEMYEDEYDDTYDDVKVAANDLDNADDLHARRLRAQQMVRQEDSEDDSDEQQSNKSQMNRQNFIENPEVVRARKEAARQRKQEEFQRRNTRKKNYQPERQNQRPQTEGESKETGKRGQEKDRRKKEVNKSSRSNHNRKNMATRKAMQGM